MPVVSSKVSQQELDAAAEYANRHGITIFKPDQNAACKRNRCPADFGRITK